VAEFCERARLVVVETQALSQDGEALGPRPAISIREHSVTCVDLARTW
jgi:hypothetical protein